MVVKILGTGCPKCRKLEANAREALKRAGVSAEVEKVGDLDGIMAYGVVVTPALVIDGRVRASGRVLSVEQVMRLMAEST